MRAVKQSQWNSHTSSSTYWLQRAVKRLNQYGSCWSMFRYAIGGHFPNLFLKILKPIFPPFPTDKGSPQSEDKAQRHQTGVAQNQLKNCSFSHYINQRRILLTTKNIWQYHWEFFGNCFILTSPSPLVHNQLWSRERGWRERERGEDKKQRSSASDCSKIYAWCL